MTGRHWKEIRRERNLLAELSGLTELKRIAGTNGGEWAGPCPNCHGQDRFKVWPYHDDDGGRFMCRKCHPKRGDCFDLDKFLGAQAQIHHAKIEAATKEARKSFRQADKKREKWSEETLKRVDRWNQKLMSPDCEAAREYLISQRGLNEDTMRTWQLGFKHVGTPQGITIPCMPDGRVEFVKVRQAKGVHPKYKMLANSHTWLFGCETFAGCTDVFLFESEFDALLAWQICRQQNGLNTGFGALPARQQLRPPYLSYTAPVERFILVADNDDAGQFHAKDLKRQLGARLKCTFTPSGNDLTEFWLSAGDSGVFETLFDALS